MSRIRLLACTVLALLAFAGNSLLCRAALVHTRIDAATFTTVRLLAGVVTLWALVALRSQAAAASGPRAGRGSWASAAALFAYAIFFSFSYAQLSTGIGALILFGAVQTTMMGYGLWSGERLRGLRLLGFVLACTGLAGLLWPGLSAPPLAGAVLMLAAGAAWGVYSLRGKGAGDPLQVTAGNFSRAAPLAVGLSVLLFAQVSWDAAGLVYAVLSGALASGVGYAIWYAALPFLRSTTAATVQLSVPVIAATGGVLFLGEPLTLRLVAAAIAILGGIALVVLTRDA